MQKDPLVSVIVPVYNVEKYLRKCLRSIIKQSYINIEIIIVNDGSTDNSSEIIQEFCCLDQRIISISKENGGLSSARNAGVRIAKGEYVWHVDSDDYAEDDCLRQMIESVLYNNADIIVTGYYCENEKYEITKIITSRYNECVSGEKALILMLNGVIGGEVWTKLYSRELYIKYHIIQNEEYSEAEDVMINFRLLQVAKKICFSDIISIHHIFRSNSYSDKSKTKKFRKKHYLGLTSLREYDMNFDVKTALGEYIAYDFLTLLKIRDKALLKELELFCVIDIYKHLSSIRHCNVDGMWKKVFIRGCQSKLIAFLLSCVIYVYISFMDDKIVNL